MMELKRRFIAPGLTFRVVAIVWLIVTFMGLVGMLQYWSAYQKTPRLEAVSFAGWAFSVCLLVGVACLFPLFVRTVRMSLPEKMCFAILMVGLIVPGSKALTGSPTAGMWLIEMLGVLGLAVTFLFRLGLMNRPPIVDDVEDTGKPFREHAFLTGSHSSSQYMAHFIMAVLWIIILGVVISVLYSLGIGAAGGESWMMWRAKVKLLALGSGTGLDVVHFGGPWTPLLWPSVWAFSAWCSGGWEEYWSRAWGAVFLLLAAWEVSSIVFRITGRSDLGILGASAMFSSPAILLISSAGCADPAAWLFVTCGFGRLLAARDRGRAIDAILAGCFAGAAALAHSNGVVFAILAFVWLALASGRGWLRLCMGYLPVVLVVCAPWAWTQRLGLMEKWLNAFASLDWGGVAGFAMPGLLGVVNVWTDLVKWSVLLLLIAAGVVYVLLKGPRNLRVGLAFPLSLLCVLFVAGVCRFGADSVRFAAFWERATVFVAPLLLVVLIPALSNLVAVRATTD